LGVRIRQFGKYDERHIGAGFAWGSIGLIHTQTSAKTNDFRTAPNRSPASRDFRGKLREAIGNSGWNVTIHAAPCLRDPNSNMMNVI
jgi:hypothetical protein